MESDDMDDMDGRDMDIHKADVKLFWKLFWGFCIFMLILVTIIVTILLK